LKEEEGSMTCIVALASEHCMVMGGDSAGISGYDLTIRSDPKVFKVSQKNGRDALLGFTSSFRMGQILMSLVLPEDRSRNDDRQAHLYFLITKVIPRIRKMLKDGGWAKVSNNTETGGTFLLAYRGVIYEINSDFQVGAQSAPYASIGAGSSFALGALDYIHRYMDFSQVSPADIVKQALEVSERNCVAVRGPMLIISI
jgi:ATP-dependent protease HslVU (ClpYQ) peptidase subunit